MIADLKRFRAKWNDEAMEIAIARLLRFGVTLSAAIVLVGGLLYMFHGHGLFQGNGARPDYRVFHGVAAPLSRTITDVLRGIRTADGGSVIRLGLLLLIATPVARVVLATVGFLGERDKLYFAISGVVLAILFYSLLFGR